MTEEDLDRYNITNLADAADGTKYGNRARQVWKQLIPAIARHRIEFYFSSVRPLSRYQPRRSCR